MKRLLASVEELQAAAGEVARSLSPGSVLALEGEMGTGKTTFAKALVAALGYRGEVTSPTFSLVQEYDTPTMPVFHFDFYRLEDECELLDLGWEDYLDQAERTGLILVEWPSLFPEALPSERTRWIRLTYSGTGREMDS